MWPQNWNTEKKPTMPLQRLPYDGESKHTMFQTLKLPLHHLVGLLFFSHLHLALIFPSMSLILPLLKMRYWTAPKGKQQEVPLQ